MSACPPVFMGQEVALLGLDLKVNAGHTCVSARLVRARRQEMPQLAV